MKILITGKPGAGKSLFSKYLNSKHLYLTLIDFDEFTDRHLFESKILNTKDCIVVIQHEKFITVSISFDRRYECNRVSKESIQVTDGFLFQRLNFKDLIKFFDPRLNSFFPS